MATKLKDAFFIGESQIEPGDIAVPQERKSPPIDAVTPDHGNYYMVDPARHLDPAHVDVEWERLWSRTWLFVGRESDLPEVGSWFKCDFGRESFIVTRPAEDEIAAFYNVCQHRGNRLVTEDFGKTSSFVCPYHSWRYDRRGACTRVTDRDLFKPEALCGSTDIPPVRCETWGGHVFVNMDDEAPSLADYLGDIPDILSGYLWDEMSVLADSIVVMECNWKTILEAFSENYHVHMAHPAGAMVVDDRFTQMDFYKGGHARRITPVGVHNSRRGPAGSANELQQMMMQRAGVDLESFDGNADDVRRAIQKAKRANPGALKRVFDRLSDGQLTDDWAMNIFPNMHLSCHAEGILLLQYIPHVTDPGLCTLRAMVLGFPEAPFDDGFYASPKATEDGARVPIVRGRHDDPDIVEKVGPLLFEDVATTRGTQQGMKSKGFTAIRLSEHEQVIRHQYAEIDRYLRRA